MLIKKLNIVFWIFLVFTIILALKEGQYLLVSSPSSGNWEIASNNTSSNAYVYEWISFINIVLLVISGILTFTVYLIKKLFEDIKERTKP